MKYKLSVLLGAASYGVLSIIVAKAQYQGFSIGEVVGSQLFIGCILLWILVIGYRPKAAACKREQKTTASIGVRPTWKERAILLAAGIPTVTTGLLYYETLRYVPNSIAILLLFQFTWMGILIQSLRLRRCPSRVMLGAIILLFIGTLFAVGIFNEQLAAVHGMGLLFGIASAISYSLYIVVNGMVVPAVHPLYRSAWLITGGMLCVFVFFPPTYLFNGVLMNELLPYGLMLGLVGVCLPMILFTYGVPHIGEGLTGILGAVELPVAVLLSSIILHEHVSAFQWIGILVVLLGVALPELKERSRRISKT